MQNKYIFLILILFSLVACGPIYQTHHDYYPPENMDGRYCLNSCDEIRQNCTSNCHDREQNCEISAQAMDAVKTSSCYKRKEYCTAHPEAPDCGNDMHTNCSHYSNRHYQCYNEACEKSCTEYYNRCFVNCGGMVDSKTVCVANCK